MRLNSKGQFGPDALIGVLIVSILGLGGIYFLNAFVSSFGLKGILSILDTEINQNCFLDLSSMLGDEYVREGANVSDDIHFSKVYNFFGGYNIYMSQSKEFNQTILYYSQNLKDVNIKDANYTLVKGYIASESYATELRNKTVNEIGSKQFQYCSLNVYSPAGKPGIAELFIVVD